MPRISNERIGKSLRIAETTRSNNKRGTQLEDLACYLFGSLPGVAVRSRDRRDFAKSQEIDILLWNDRLKGGLDFLPELILVECKCWSKPVGSQNVDWFHTKLVDRGLSFGVLFAARGITGNPDDHTGAHDIIAKALPVGRRIIVLTSQDIQSITNTSQLTELFKKKLCDLIANRTCF